MNPAARIRTLLVAAGAIVALFAGVLYAPSTANAVSGADFNAGNIISDSVFYDGNAMTTADVQAFLGANMSRCSIGDPGRAPGTPYGNTSVAGKCFKDYTVTTASRAANAYCNAYPGATNESSAQIVAKVGKVCGISQRVLLVLLEKEQSLITDSWPFELQYRSATGYGCPDTAACDSDYYGLYNQIYMAAWQFKAYQARPTSYNYRPQQTNTILWNPNAACGTSQVYIENSATAGLYNYTPYRPNQAALNNLYGTGDSCSSYGNRNFWRIFSDWFGSTAGITHASLDTISGEYGGIRVGGWARKLADPDRTGTAYVWVNIYDTAGALVTGQAIAANQPLGWFNSYFPGWGSNHGYNSLVRVSPGTYTVRLYNSSVDGQVFATRTVAVPIGQGHVDSVSQTVGGIRMQGWSVDFRTPTTLDRIRVVLNGREVSQAFTADRPTSWIERMFPGAGNNHAFDITIPASIGTHTVCVYGAAGLLDACKSVTLKNVEYGSLDTVTPVNGGVRVTGWAVNMGTADPIAPSIVVNGTSTKVRADQPLSWFNSYYPGAGNDHGFDAMIPMEKSGSYEFCLVGERTGAKLSCKTQTIRAGSATSFDSASALNNSVRITGWSAVFGNTAPNYIWVNIDGVGRAYRADLPLSWFDRYAPGSGNNHGFDVTIAASPGPHEICIFDAATSVSAGCKSVTVPSPLEQGSLDSLTGGAGSIHATGWSQISGQPTPSYVWVDVDGQGSVFRADKTLGWFNSYFPGQGNEHGFDITLAAAPGSHRVCVYGSQKPTLYGCASVAVQ